PKLLRFLENGEFRRIGGITTLSSNIRIIAATNRNLMEFADQKKFRRDLLFRLNIITLTIPPLAERGNDISLLAEFFLNQKCSINSPKTLSPEAKSELLNYEFPGNVRELEHIIERAIIFSEGNIIELRDLNLPKFGKLSEYEEGPDEDILKLDDIERLHIRKALNLFEWNRENTARALGISQKTLYTKIKKYSLK
ncbi:MAG: sigma-54-dependent Fis family transcriptional regulator, partial [Ignavibacteriae bacterium]|nr:sigma-54-dependent Fis family transcriptional regulator [Ignavibacteriota bacterium]